MNGNNRLTTEPSTEIRAVIEQLRGLAPARPAQDTADASAYKLGKYRILNALSVRGQAYVFLAYDEELERQVVIKLYHEGLDELQRQRLLTEGKALARISSPWVARCLAVEQFDGQPALVIEYVPGATLACTGPGQIEPWQAVTICSKIARGVAAVHAAGLLHRDLKPSNVILMDDAEPRIIDFGLAQLVGDPENCDSSGTPAFMPPERARHDFASIDERSDVFGIAAILYFLLTGSPPFAGESSQASRELARAGGVRPIRELNPGIDELLASLCMSCLERDIEARPSSARQLAESLETMQNQLRVKPMSPTKIAVGIAALLIGLVAIGVTISRMGNTPETPPETPQVASSTTDHSASVSEDRAEQLLPHLAAGEPEAIELRSDFELPWTLDGEVVQATASRPFSITPDDNQYKIQVAPTIDCHLEFVVFQRADPTGPMTYGVHPPNRDGLSIDLQGHEPSPSNEYLYVKATERMNRSIRVVSEPSIDGPRITELLIPFRVTAAAAGGYAWQLELRYLELASQGNFDKLLEYVRRQARDQSDPQPAELEKIVALDDESKSRLAASYVTLQKASQVPDTGVEDLDALMRELNSAVATITELAGIGSLTSLRAMYAQFELLNYVGRRDPALQSIRKIFELLPENSPHRLQVQFDYAEVLGRKFLFPESDRLLHEVIDDLHQDPSNSNLTPAEMNLLARAKLRQAHNRRAAGKEGLARSLFAELTEMVRDDPRVTDEIKARVFEAYAVAIFDPRDRGPSAREMGKAAIHIEKAAEQETAADRRTGLVGYANSLAAQQIMMQGDFAGARERYERALEHFRQSASLRDQYCHTLMAFGQNEVASRKYDRSIELINQCRQGLIHLNGGPSLELNVVVDVLGFIYRIAGRNDESIAVLKDQLDQIHEDPRVDPENRSVASLWKELGKSRFMSNQPELATQCFQESLRIYAGVIPDILLFPDEVEIASFATDIRYVAGYLLQLAEYQTGRQVFDSLRMAKGVTRRLTAWRNRILARPEYRELREQLTSVQRQIAQYVVRTAEPGAELDRLKNEKRELLTKIHDQIAADRFWETSRGAWQQLEDLLDPGIAVIDFFLGVDAPASMNSKAATYYALIVKKNPAGELQTKLVTLGTVLDVNRQIVEITKSTEVPGLEFWKTLIPELEGMDAVVFCPDGQLVSLPFAMMPGVESDSDFLVEDMQVNYATSITDLAVSLSRKPITAERSHLIVADVEYGPLVEIEGKAWAKEHRGGAVGFAPLTFDDEESEAYGNSLGETANIRYLTGDEATEENLAEQMPNHTDIYLITHGFSRDALRELMAEDARPTRSRFPWSEYGLVWAGANRVFEAQTPEPSPDQIQTAQEILGLDLNSVDLVILSACHSGLGREFPAEGMTSVQHAFLLAGARSTISSLDVVEDSRAKDFMVALGEYRRRNPDASKAEALRQTQLAMIEKGWPPRDWAIWVLYGDPR